jgi:hypothetical protein
MSTLQITGHPRRPKRLRFALADRVNRTCREGHAEQITCELDDSAARDTVPGSQRHDRRLQTRSEHRRADPVRQPGAGRCQAVQGSAAGGGDARSRSR